MATPRSHLQQSPRAQTLVEGATLLRRNPRRPTPLRTRRHTPTSRRRTTIQHTHMPAHQQTLMRRRIQRSLLTHPRGHAVSAASTDEGGAASANPLNIVREQLVAEELRAARIARKPHAAHIHPVRQGNPFNESADHPAVRTGANPPVIGQRRRIGANIPQSRLPQATRRQHRHRQHIELSRHLRQLGTQRRSTAQQAATGTREMITIKIEQHTGRRLRLGQKVQVIDPVVDIAAAMRKRPVAEKLRGRQQHRLHKGNARAHSLCRIGQQRMQPRDMCAEPTLIAVPPLLRSTRRTP